MQCSQQRAHSVLLLPVPPRLPASTQAPPWLFWASDRLPTRPCDCTTADQDRILLCSALMTCAVDTVGPMIGPMIGQGGLSCLAHTSTAAYRSPEAAMTAFRECSSTAQDRAGAVCEQPFACRSCIRSAAPLCLCSPVLLGDSALKLRGLNHGASDCIGSRQLL